MTIDTIA
ncbi:hypothetical protein YPPY66_5067, partial [Yersinia pestis PY-66]